MASIADEIAATSSAGPWTIGDKPAWASKRSMRPIRDAEGKVVAYIMNRGAQTDANAATLASAWTMLRLLSDIYPELLAGNFYLDHDAALERVGAIARLLESVKGHPV